MDSPVPGNIFVGKADTGCDMEPKPSWRTGRDGELAQPQATTDEPPSPSSLNVKQTRRQSMQTPRRQSSISYITSSPTQSSVLPSPTGFARPPIHSSHARSPGNAAGFGFGGLRSPLSASASQQTLLPSSATPSEGSTVVSLGRSQSVSGPSRGNGVPTSRGLKSPGFERSSTGSLASGGPSVDQKLADAVKHLKERPPMTLAEKHADLLQFIAQKESKCLELRSQLAVHEGELLQLKKKWERIVNRGFDKSSSPTSSPSLQNTNGSVVAAAYNMPLSPGTHAPVLEGIKEGVQGVGRFFAAMTGSTGVAPSETDSPKRAEDISGPSGSSSTSASGILPLRLVTAASVSSEKESDKEIVIDGELEKQKTEARGSKLERRTSRYGHGQKESQSSSSTNASTSTSISTSTSVVSGFSTVTAASTATTASMSSRRDRSSVVSLKDAEFIGSPLRQDSTLLPTPISAPAIVGSSEAESEFGDFHEGISSASISSSSISGSEQVLYVRDTGATPMMSPNPEFERKRRKKERKEAKGVQRNGCSTPASAGKGLEDSLFDAWDDTSAWPEPAAGEANGSIPSSPATSGGPTKVSSQASSKSRSMRTVPLSTAVQNLQPKRVPNPQQPQALPPMSSIPGLATMGMAAPAAHQVSSWVGSVGKKWGDLKGSSTFTKNQKRASLLLSDMQNTFVSALGSPIPPGASASPSNPNSKSPHLSPHDHPQLKRTASASSSTSASLLDDSDEELRIEGDDTIKVSTPVLVPSPASPISPFTVGGKEKENTPEVKDDEEWNW